VAPKGVSTVKCIAPFPWTLSNENGPAIAGMGKNSTSTSEGAEQKRKVLYALSLSHHHQSPLSFTLICSCLTTLAALKK
jgi:hypothetical protein